MNKSKLLVCSTAIVAIACVLMSGCKKKEVQEGPVEETLTAITLNDLSAGNFYVKSGDSFYLLPYEDQNFDISKEVKSTEDSENGMIKQDDNRIIPASVIRWLNRSIMRSAPDQRAASSEMAYACAST